MSTAMVRVCRLLAIATMRGSRTAPASETERIVSSSALRWYRKQYMIQWDLEVADRQDAIMRAIRDLNAGPTP